MKKLSKYLLSIIVAFFILISIGTNKYNNSFAENWWDYPQYECNNFYYYISDGEATILGHRGSTSNLVIPSQLDGYRVKAIKSEAFMCCDLKTVYIPASVRDIGYHAFWGDNNLENITVSENNEYYADYNGILYTKDKTKLLICPPKKEGSIFIEDGVLEIEDCAFYNCVNLKNLIIPNSVKTIGGAVFHGSNLTNITIKKSVELIRTEFLGEEIDDDFGRIFTGCNKLKEIWLYKDSYAYNFLNSKYHLNIKLIDKYSTLDIEGENYPTIISQGKSFKLTGKINSNYKLMSVIVQVLDEYSNVVSTASKTVYPDSYTYSDIDSGIKFGTLPVGHYKYQVIASDTSGNKKKLIDKDFEVVKQSVSIGDVTNLKYTSTTSTETLSWSKVSKASGYEIWMYKSSVGDYTKIKTITSGSTTSYKRSSLTSATMYRYKLRAYRTVNGVKYYGNFTNEFITGTKPLTPSITLSSTQKGKIKITWSNISKKTTGYQIYRATSRYGTYTKIATVEDGNIARSYTNSGRTSGKTYYYKVRAYRTLDNGKKVYSSYSTVKYKKSK